MAVKAPTLQDVADAAGVSTATVSRCLNQPDKVVKSTRDRVLRVVTELGYAPNFSARALVARQTKTIGAIIPTMENAIFAEGMQAFQETLQAEGYTLLIASSSYDSELEAQEIRNLVARGADALLLVGLDRDAALYGFLETQSVPVVTAWAHDPNAVVTSIGFDNRSAMAALATKAIGLGHRRIGMISADRLGNDRARSRIEGVQDAMRAAGLSPNDLVLQETRYGLAEGGAAFQQLLGRAPDLSLVICGNDVLAAGAIRKAMQLGIEVPGRISVTGFDDIALAQLVTPGLTTVRVPHRTMGEAAAQALVAKVQGKPAVSLKLETEICFRDSLVRPN